MALINYFDAIAAAIREKTDETGQMSLEQMARKINAIVTSTEPGTIYTPAASDYSITTKLAALGNAIRSKTGGTARLTLAEMPDAIRSINGAYVGEWVEAEGLEYKFYSGEGYFKIAGKGTCPGGNIIIPQWVGSYRFKGIEDSALSGWDELTGIRFPEDLSANLPITDTYYTRYIGRGAFYRCENLKYVELIDVGGMDEEVFYYCSNLKQLKLINVKSIGASAFRYCNNLTNIEFSGKWQCYIGMHAFWGCQSLQVLDSTVSLEIGPYAFCECPSLTHVGFSGIYVFVMSHAFSRCANLEEVRIEREIGNSHSYGAGFHSHAFSDCPKLATVVLDKISYNTGYGDWDMGLAHAGINNATNIGLCGKHEKYKVFSNCPALTDIYLDPSIAMPAGAPWGAENATVHHGEVEPETELVPPYDSFTRRGVGEPKLNGNYVVGFYSITGEERIDIPFIWSFDSNLKAIYTEGFTGRVFESFEAEKRAAVKILCLPSGITNAPVLVDDLPNLEQVHFIEDVGLAASAISPPTDFNASTFKNLSALHTVKFGNVDVQIHGWAFHNLPSLTQLNLKGKTTNAWLQAFAFAECEGLEQITFEAPEDGVNVNDADNLISECAFYKCPNLKKVNFLWDESYGPLGVHTYIGTENSDLKEQFENGTANNTEKDGSKRSNYSASGDCYWWKNHGITVYFNGVISTIYN